MENFLMFNNEMFYALPPPPLTNFKISDCVVSKNVSAHIIDVIFDEGMASQMSPSQLSAIITTLG